MVFSLPSVADGSGGCKYFRLGLVGSQTIDESSPLACIYWWCRGVGTVMTGWTVIVPACFPSSTILANNTSCSLEAGTTPSSTGTTATNTLSGPRRPLLTTRWAWLLNQRTISPTSSLFLAQRSSTYSEGNMEKFWGENVRSTPTSITSGWIESTESHVI